MILTALSSLGGGCTEGTSGGSGGRRTPVCRTGRPVPSLLTAGYEGNDRRNSCHLTTFSIG
ncbi:protein of unknown function [Streptomyces sp. KY70]|nr:protein of unknown function [Streptomyces sp. KY70]